MLGLGLLEAEAGIVWDGAFRFNTTEMTANCKQRTDTRTQYVSKRAQAIHVVWAEGRKGQASKPAWRQPEGVAGNRD